MAQAEEQREGVNVDSRSIPRAFKQARIQGFLNGSRQEKDVSMRFRVQTFGQTRCNRNASHITLGKVGFAYFQSIRQCILTAYIRKNNAEPKNDDRKDSPVRKQQTRFHLFQRKWD